MNIPKISAYTAMCLLIIVGILAISCSDDDKSVTPTPHSVWAPLGTGKNGDVTGLNIYDNKLIAGGGSTKPGE